MERYTNGAAQHYQYENAIMAYLWLRYPDKYYIYKFSEVKAVSSELESDYRFKKGAYVDNIRNFMAYWTYSIFLDLHSRTNIAVHHLLEVEHEEEHLLNLPCSNNEK